jgi:hypothetical protein
MSAIEVRSLKTKVVAFNFLQSLIQMWRACELVNWERGYQNAITVADRINLGEVSFSCLKNGNSGKNFTVAAIIK